MRTNAFAVFRIPDTILSFSFLWNFLEKSLIRYKCYQTAKFEKQQNPALKTECQFLIVATGENQIALCIYKVEMV